MRAMEIISIFRTVKIIHYIHRQFYKVWNKAWHRQQHSLSFFLSHLYPGNSYPMAQYQLWHVSDFFLSLIDRRID